MNCVNVNATENGEVVWLELNRPEKLNTMTTELMEELYERLCDLETNLTCRVVILIGKGTNFCAGADLLAQSRGIGGVKWDSSRMHNQEKFSRVIVKMTEIPQPIICAVQGACVGGGLGLFTAANIRYCSPCAKFGAAFLNIGLSGCELGSSFFLPKIIGMAKAQEMMLTGDLVYASEAKEIGLVNKVVEKDQLRDTALEMARKMLKASPLGLRITKRQLTAVLDPMSLTQAIQKEDIGQLLCLNDKPTLAAMAIRTERFRNKSKI